RPKRRPSERRDRRERASCPPRSLALTTAQQTNVQPSDPMPTDTSNATAPLPYFEQTEVSPLHGQARLSAENRLVALCALEVAFESIDPEDDEARQDAAAELMAMVETKSVRTD